MLIQESHNFTFFQYGKICPAAGKLNEVNLDLPMTLFQVEVGGLVEGITKLVTAFSTEVN